ncbi:MAG: choice-of-anchor tandem repeat GloVer-containing protein [Candidatus Korobacteraceae bacterium]
MALFCAVLPLASFAQEYTTLANFDRTNGTEPTAALIQGADGNFYGTTEYGGVGKGSDTCLPPYSGCGTIFKVTPSGTVTSLYSFCSQTNCSDGEYPHAALVRGVDGSYYGTTVFGGNCPDDEGVCGTVFKITPTGTFTQLYVFCSQTGCLDGYWPVGGLVLASDGNFYGTTQGGGTHGDGTVYRITPAGTLTTIYDFCSLQNCADGSQPQAALIQASDGNLYGTAWLGGTSGFGTVFRITTNGTLTTLHGFNGNYGSYPVAALVQATDGNFYGTTQTGGGGSYCYGGCGTVFKITPSGTFTTLYSFSGSDGGLALAGLLQAKDGNLYGTTWNGGANDDGTVFKITTSGTLTTLHNFTGSDGGATEGAFLQAPDGSLYGTTGLGGTSDNGTVFRLTFPLQFVPVTPCRLVDTRQSGDPIQGGTYRNFIVPQLGNCNIPASAAAYSLNVTVVPQGPLGYLTVWPAGESQPLVSTMNSTDGRVKANAAIVPAGASAAVSVYASSTTNLILDIDGYFESPGPQTYQFYPVTPCRVVDTRSGSDEPPGLGPPSLQAQQQRDLPILSSPCLQGITNPVAYSFNVTVVPNPAGQPLDYLTVWPSNQTQPVVSTLNNPTATVVANAAIVSAAPDGDIDVYAYNSTDLIIDINGYFAAPAQNGLSMYTAPPCRVLDTRQNNGQPFMGPKVVNVVGSPCPPPANAQAYVLNATVVPPGSMPYLTLWPDGQQQPVVSTLNAYDGFITSNMAIVPTTNGSIDAYADALTQLILDISGYFAP